LSSGCIVPVEPESSAGEAWLGWGAARRVADPEPGRLSVYAPDFFLREARPWWVFESSRRVPLAELNAALRAASPGPRPTEAAITWEPARFADFEALFADLQRRIRAGELAKAVPAGFSRGRGPASSAWLPASVAAALDTAAASPLHVYGLWNAWEGVLGATPELLFRSTGPRSIATAAVAGTRPHAVPPDARLPLMDDPKEIEEHEFVLQGIREAFGGMGVVHAGATTELRLAGFSHLFAPVDVCFEREQPFAHVVRALHPTPAVGGWPRDASMEWLHWMERRNEATGAGLRGRFAAPFGAVPPDGAGICWVAIRGVQWTQQPDGAALRLAAGCGVTARSELHREWHELELKLRAIRSALAI
jgi:menaquinone-specific isochorismate synthase